MHHLYNRQINAFYRGKWSIMCIISYFQSLQQYEIVKQILKNIAASRNNQVKF